MEGEDEGQEGELSQDNENSEGVNLIVNNGQNAEHPTEVDALPEEEEEEAEHDGQDDEMDGEGYSPEELAQLQE